MTMKKFLTLITLILFIQTNVFATTAYLAGIDEAIDIALKSSGELRAGQAHFGLTEAKVFTANTRLNPVLISDSGIAEKTYRVGVQMIIETAGKRKKRTRLAQKQRDIAENEIDAKLLDIKAQVRKAYIELYAAQNKEKSIEDLINTADYFLSSGKDKKYPGITEADIIQIEIIKLKAEMELEKAHSELLQAHSVLNVLLGHSLEKSCVLEAPSLKDSFKDVVALTDESHKLNLDELNKKAMENRPEVKLYEDNIKLANLQLDVAKANIIPNVLLASGPDMVSNSPGTLNVGAFIMTAVEIPLFDRQQGPIKEAKMMQKVAAEEYENKKGDILNEVYDAYERIVFNTKLITQYDNETIPRAKDLVERSLNYFKEHKKDPVTLLTAKETSMNVRLTYIRLMSEYQNAISDLERAIGVSL